MVTKKLRRDKNGNSPLDKDIGRVTIKIPHSLNVQLRMRHKAAKYTKCNASKRIHYLIYTLKILAWKQVSTELPNMCSYSIANREAHASMVIMRM